jgi:hypothetical protein
MEAPKDYPNLLAAMALLANESTPVGSRSPGKALLDEIRGETHRPRSSGFCSACATTPACMAVADATVLASAEACRLSPSNRSPSDAPCFHRRGGVREIVEHGRSGFVATQESESLATAMSAMMARSETERRQMGVLGRTHIERNFALDRVVECWSGLLNDLVGAVA